MTELAYDPDRLRALAMRMTAAVAEVRRFTTTDPAVADPAAADAFRQLQRAQQQIEQVWLPLIRRLLTADPLARRNDGTDLLDLPVLRLDADGARDLAQMLGSVNLDELRNDPRQWDMLAAELQLLDRDPQARAAFRETLHDWARLTDALADERAWRQAEDDTLAVAKLNAPFARLAGELQADLGQLDTLQPYSAALVVRHLRLDPIQLADIADRLVLRWCDEPWSEASIGTASQFAERSQPNPADLLFTLLAADPRSAQHYVALAAAHPCTLFSATTQPGAVRQVVLTATDPDHVSAPIAGVLLVPLLDWFRTTDDRAMGSAVYDDQWQSLLADMIAPWTRQLGPLNHDWGLTADHQRQLVALLAEDDDTIDRLVQQADVVRRGLTASDLAPTTLEEFAAYLGMLQQVIVSRREADEQRAVAGWSMLVGIAGLAGGLIPGGWPVALVVGIGVGALGSTHPIDVDRARHDAEFTKESTLTVAARSVAAAVHRRWIADGSLPAGFPPPPVLQPDAPHPGLAFRDAFDSWLARLPGGVGGEMADHADRMVSTLLNAADAGAAVAR